MIRLLITILLMQAGPNFMNAQNDETFEIEADEVNAKSNSDLQIFYKKFKLWVSEVAGSDTVSRGPESEFMINDFVIFTEDGLIMKDLDFHSVESCKKRLLASMPERKSNKTDKNWIYISLESHVNTRELIEVLAFFREEKIEYYFGSEVDFVPGIRGE